jgi:hypothetical protein
MKSLLLIVICWAFAVTATDLEALSNPFLRSKAAVVKGSDINYVAAHKFNTGDCSGASTLIGILQDTCIPNFDLGTTPPTLKGYQIYTQGAQSGSLTLTNFALADNHCKGASTSSNQLTENVCVPVSSQLSFKFSSGTTPANMPTVHGLFYVSYSSMAACSSMDQKGLIAISQLTSSYSVPAAYWGAPMKITCGNPSLVEVVALPPSTLPPTTLQLGACSIEAPGGYAIRLQCFK